MKCSRCGEEVGSVEICPICGANLNQQKNVSVSNSNSNKDILDGAAIYEKNINGVIEVFTLGGAGSGYLVTPDGYAITNAHVVAQNNGKCYKNCSVKVAGTTVSAKVVAMGTELVKNHATVSDLALIKLDRVPLNAKPLDFTDSESVRIGEAIYTIGNPYGEGICITSGIIGDTNRGKMFMHDCATNPGNSGGPVFNKKGCVIATEVASALRDGIRPLGMSFAIPTKYVKAFLDKNSIKAKYKK